jgi:sugar phosphate isomerase/epimerase
MIQNVLSIFLLLLSFPAFAQREVPLYTLHNIIRGDSVYDTFDKQVPLLKEAGFAGVEINQIDSFEGMMAALNKHQFRGFYFYIRVNVDEGKLDPRLPGYVTRLKGSGVILSPFFISASGRHKPSSHTADTTVVRLTRELADLARPIGLQVAIYPHIGFYVERTTHAVELARQVNRRNAGMSFNLCHWLATTPKTERGHWKEHLRELKPYLKMLTICGANNVDNTTKNPWSDFILPLGTGSFDTFELVRFYRKDLRCRGPIGVQCYGITGNKPALIRNTMAVWRTNQQRLFD